MKNKQILVTVDLRAKMLAIAAHLYFMTDKCESQSNSNSLRIHAERMRFLSNKKYLSFFDLYLVTTSLYALNLAWFSSSHTLSDILIPSVFEKFSVADTAFLKDVISRSELSSATFFSLLSVVPSLVAQIA